MSNNVNLTIGSDPEFVIMCGDSVENALEIFQKVSQDMECQYECPHPDQDDIENAWTYGDKKIYFEDAIEHLTPYYLAPEYSHSKSGAIKLFYEEQSNCDLYDVYHDKVKKDLKFSIKVIKEITDIYYIGTYMEKQGIAFNELDKDEQIETIEEAIQEELDIENWYDLLEPEQQRIYDKLLREQIVEFYEYSEYQDLDDLPDEIQYNIREDIVENYEVDCSTCEANESYFCTTELGCDGQSALGEMRPKEGNDPIEHFNEILKLMKKLSELLEPEIV